MSEAKIRVTSLHEIKTMRDRRQAIMRIRENCKDIDSRVCSDIDDCKRMVQEIVDDLTLLAYLEEG